MEHQEACDRTYGYFRMWRWLHDKHQIYQNPKTILKIMRENELLSVIRRRHGETWELMYINTEIC